MANARDKMLLSPSLWTQCFWMELFHTFHCKTADAELSPSTNKLSDGPVSLRKWKNPARNSFNLICCYEEHLAT